MGPAGTAIAAVSLVLAGLLLPAGQAAAQPPEEETAQGSMMFVLDASGSMEQPMPTGGTRMDAAKRAMNTLIDQLPVNLHVGLEVYGTSTSDAPADKAKGCQDVQVLQPVGPVDKPAMRAHVAEISPRGFTPIGAAVQRAADELPSSGPRAIVLVSDGIDTCAPPAPCDVARDLSGAGVELAVHTVGFRVGAKARAELECIAEETGGEYHDAPDGESLGDLLPEIAERALRTYDVRGDLASGSTELADAEFLPPGQYTDNIDKDTAYFYEVSVPDGATGYFTVVHVVEQNDERWDSEVRLRLIDYARRTCARDRGYREYGYDGPETASVVWTSRPDERHCDPNGPHFLEVRWNNTQHSSNDEIELVVELEAPVTGDRGEPETAAVDFAPPEVEPDIAWGGGSFNEAAPLPGTGRYLDRIRYSEYSIYKVWLEWGQSLSYQVRFLDSESSGAATAVAELRGPARANAREHWYTSTDYSGSEVSLEPISTPAVRYANRDGDELVRHASRAGWYYLVVKLSPVWTEDVASEVQPTFELAVSVNGDPAQGPAYAELTTPTSAPPRPSGEPTWTPPAGTADARAAVHEDLSVPGWTLWTIAALGGVLLAAVVLLLLRRRQSRQSR